MYYVAEKGSVVAAEGARGRIEHFAGGDESWNLILVSRAHLRVLIECNAEHGLTTMGIQRGV